MAEKQKKEHICSRMVGILEKRGLTVGKWEAENKISNGYLRRSAKEGTNIGLDVIENFLDSFPEVDVNWLITGKELGINTDKKHTAATFSDEAAVRAELRKMRNEIRVLKELTTTQAKALLHFTSVEAIEEG